ncbi:MAG: M20 family metallopeptidase [Actinomycetes bacterium]
MSAPDQSEIRQTSSVTFLADLKSLIECESPTEDLAACEKVIHLAIEIANRQLPITANLHQENGRPVFWWGSQTPKVLLLAHLDTVWPHGSFEPIWQVEDDVIRGPGVFDMKAGFLQALYAIKNLPGCETDVALVATTDEEVGSQTSRDLIQRLAKGAEAVLVLESSLDGKVKTARKGTAMYQVTVHGRAAHAGLEPEKGINTTVEIARLILQITGLADSESGTTVVPTLLQSGTSTNTVPAQATLHLDIRSFSMAELERVDLAINSLTPTDLGATLEITGGINRPPLEAMATKELYDKLELVAQAIGAPPLGHAAVGGASDGNFAAAVGAKTLDGLGAVGAGAHADHEHVLLSTIAPRIELLTAFIKELIRD